ncbi:hypothetical protein ACQPW1_30125 [Nocardia sp. CA-128927]|uniref:hypothetical protein n=1 Tax=Nocardia sp. CA-128927 TaxID=3239975 RepID=UPI003D969DB4
MGAGIRKLYSALAVGAIALVPLIVTSPAAIADQASPCQKGQAVASNYDIPKYLGTHDENGPRGGDRKKFLETTHKGRWEKGTCLTPNKKVSGNFVKTACGSGGFDTCWLEQDYQSTRKTFYEVKSSDPKDRDWYYFDADDVTWA